MAHRHIPLSALMLAIAVAGCAPATDSIDPKGETFDAVAPDDVVNLVGTEPFWSMQIEGGEGVWSTPDNIAGTGILLSRFAGNNGLGFSGDLDGKPFTAMLTPGQCSDGMSDRTYPYVATIALGEETLRGCGYTDSQPFTGDAAP